MKQQAPKGTQDILPEITPRWQFVEKKFQDVCHLYGYEEIRVPTFEHTEVFERGVGDTTDIVKKEMYTFDDKGGRSLTLRPEGTAGVVRSFVENGLASTPSPQKLFYMITAFRYENVQKGRYREFHQLGVEAFGSAGPGIDAEILAMLHQYFNDLGLESIELRINSIGCPKCRAEYRDALITYFEPHKEELCEDCKERLYKNPMRLLDCKVESCHKFAAEAPSILDYLDEECKAHFEALQAALDKLGIPYIVDANIVRGLDYYTRTVFEFVSENVGTQGTICAGGRYDGLVEALGGPSTPGIGFAMGEERLLMELEAQSKLQDTRNLPLLYIANMGDEAWQEAQSLGQKLRLAGVPVQYDLMNRSMKAQMKFSGKCGARYLMVLGESELESRQAGIRSLENRDAEEVQFSLDDVEGIKVFLKA